MCQKRCTVRKEIVELGNVVPKIVRLDACIVDEVESKSIISNHTMACCCGHGKYKKTLVMFDRGGMAFELYSGVKIPRRRRFYKKDPEGFYYIPEVEEQRSPTKR